MYEGLLTCHLSLLITTITTLKDIELSFTVLSTLASLQQSSDWFQSHFDIRVTLLTHPAVHFMVDSEAHRISTVKSLTCLMYYTYTVGDGFIKMMCSLICVKPFTHVIKDYKYKPDLTLKCVAQHKLRYGDILEEMRCVFCLYTRLHAF